MATFRSFADFNRELAALQRDFDQGARRRIAFEQAVAAQRIARSAAASDLGGDPKFSGWAPELVTLIKSGRDGSAVLHPSRSSAGPWTVAEFGRNQGNSGGFAGPAAPRFNKSGSLRKVRARKARRWNGYTSGKGTATDAVRTMDRELPLIAADGFRRITRKHFDVD